MCTADGDAVRRYPLSLLLGSVLMAFMIVTLVDAGVHARLTDALSVSWPQIRDGRLWRLPTSSLVQEDSGIVVPIVVLLATLPFAESRFGAPRALLIYLLCDAASSLLALGLLELIGDERLAAEPNIGSSAGLLGLLAAWIATLPRRHGGRAGAALVVGLAIAFGLDPELSAVQHIIAAAVGAALGSSTFHLARRSYAV